MTADREEVRQSRIGRWTRPVGLGISWHERVVRSGQGESLVISVPLTGKAPPPGFDAALTRMLSKWWIDDQPADEQVISSIDVTITELHHRPTRRLLTLTLALGKVATPSHGRIGRELRRAVAIASRR